MLALIDGVDYSAKLPSPIMQNAIAHRKPNAELKFAIIQYLKPSINIVCSYFFQELTQTISHFRVQHKRKPGNCTTVMMKRPHKYGA